MVRHLEAGSKLESNSIICCPSGSGISASISSIRAIIVAMLNGHTYTYHISFSRNLNDVCCDEAAKLVPDRILLLVPSAKTGFSPPQSLQRARVVFTPCYSHGKRAGHPLPEPNKVDFTLLSEELCRAEKKPLRCVFPLHCTLVYSFPGVCLNVTYY